MTNQWKKLTGKKFIGKIFKEIFTEIVQCKRR
jgi:hypothetical protein